MSGHFVVNFLTVTGSLNFWFLEGAMAEVLNTLREAVLVTEVVDPKEENICSYKSSSPVFPDSRDRVFA